jgi:polysaccharide biosynthesis protein VpsM
MSKNPLRAAVLAALVGSSALAYGQTTPIGPYRPATGPSTSGPLGVRLGDSPVFFAPFVNLGVGYDDNVGLTPSNEVSSPLYILSPGFLLDARDASKIFQLSYQGAIGHYSDSEDDNYVDHTVRASMDWAISGRQALRLGYDAIRGHEARGLTDRSIVAGNTRPDKFRATTPSVLYAFGSPGAQGRVEAWYGETHKRYVNNRTTTTFADRNNEDYGASFYWRVMPRTHALVEIRRTNIDYTNPASIFDSREDRVYGGVTWEASAATSGTIKVGSLRKRFDSGLPRFNGTAWEGLVSWSPRTYSRLDIYTSRQPVEASGLGNFIVSEAVGATWTHQWNSLLSTGINARLQRDEYQGFNREDDVKSIGAKVGYKFRRWLTLGAEFTHTTRDSNFSASDYDRNLWLVTAQITL